MASSKVMHREELMKKTNCEIPNVPLLARRGYLCFRCWKPSERMTKCTGCRRNYYCAKACQELDWKIQHKRHCKILRHINTIEQKDTFRSQSWGKYQESLYYKLKYVKSVSPDALPQDTVQGQPYCSTCYRNGIQTANAETSLTACEKCHMIFTCGVCEPSHGEGQCLEYQNCGRVEMYRIEHFERSRQAQCRAPMNVPRTQYRALSTASNWMDYFANVSDKGFLRGFVAQDISIQNLHQWKFPHHLEGDKQNDAWRLLMYHVLATDTLTMPVSIVAALEESRQGLVTKETISVHFIGAAGKELTNLMMFEEILHLLPSLKHLRMTLVGPGDADQPDGKLSNKIECNCCPACVRCGRARTVELYQGLYHDYAKTSQYEKPDIAVLFHSGRTQEAEAFWRPTTRFLVESGTMTLCTAYNESEAMEEAAELASLGAHFVVHPEVNKWKSLVPALDFTDGPEHREFYHNFFRYVFQGRM